MTLDPVMLITVFLLTGLFVLFASIIVLAFVPAAMNLARLLDPNRRPTLDHGPL